MPARNYPRGPPTSTDDEPITTRHLASTRYAFFAVTILCLLGRLHGVACARINNGPQTSSGIKDGTSSVSHQSDSDFNCPADWHVNKDSCFKLIKTPLSWDNAKGVCERHDGVLADFQSILSWEWVHGLVQSQSIADHGEDTLNITVSNDGSYIGLWAGIQRFGNGSFLWTDGSQHNIALQPGAWKTHRAEKETDGERMCVEVLLTPGNTENSVTWQLSKCGLVKPFVCRMEACPGFTVHCLRESRCVPLPWICDGQMDCELATDETMCNKSDNSLRQTSFCGNSFKSDTGGFTSPNYPHEYPQLARCSWTIETDTDKILVISVSNVDIEDGHDIVWVYDGVKLTTGSTVKDLTSSNQSRTFRMRGNVATVQFFSDNTNHGTGFNVSWESEFYKETPACGGEIFVSEETSTFEMNASELNPARASLSEHTTCDWVLTSNATGGRISVQITSLELWFGESLKLFEGPADDVEETLIAHYNASTHNRTRITLGSKRDYHGFMSRYLEPTVSFVPIVIVTFDRVLTIRLQIMRGRRGRRRRSSAYLKFVYYQGCHNSVSSNPVIILSPGFSLSRYPNNLNCSWSLRAEPEHNGSKSTMLVFPGFHTEDGKDIMQITSQNLQATLSGRQHEMRTLSLISDSTVQFTSDSTVNVGQWIAIVSRDNCEAPKDTNGLMATLSTTHFGSKLTHSCQEGYTLNGGSNTSFCGVFGKWIPHNTPTCSVTSCVSPPTPLDGYLTSVTSVKYGGVAVFQCHNGYRLHGDKTSTCGSHGWSAVPRCMEITCPKEPPPDRGMARAEELRLGALRQYFCKPPYKLVGSTFSHCNTSGLWTDSVPSCHPLTCPDPPRLANGRFNVTVPVIVGGTIEAICDDGCVLEGSALTTCQPGLRFGGPLPKCIDIDECSGTATPCGEHHCQNSHGAFQCFCLPGFRRTNAEAKSHCTDVDECAVGNGGCSHKCVNTAGSYTCECPDPLTLHTGQEIHTGTRTLQPLHTCIAKCLPLTTSDYMDEVFYNYDNRPLDSGLYLQGTRAIMGCPRGSRLIGEAVVTCSDNGTWTSYSGQCKEYKCTEPSPIPNGIVVFDGLDRGGHVTYSCLEGFRARGHLHRFCLPGTDNDENEKDNYKWSGEVPVCEVVTCPALPDPTNGRVFTSSVSYKAIAVFQCLCGYTLVGKTFLECTAHGQWSDPLPFCEAQSCRRPDTRQPAVISHSTAGFPVWSAAKYRCPSTGYEMSGSDILVCQPGERFNTISKIKPLYGLNLLNTFAHTNKDHAILTHCLKEHDGILAAEAIIYSIIQSHCPGMDVNVFVLNTEAHYLEGQVALHTNLSIASSTDTSASYICGTRLKSLSNIILPRIAKFWAERLASVDTNCSNTILLQPTNTGKIGGGGWHCWDGLKLGDSDVDGEMVCLEGCKQQEMSVHDIIQTLKTKDVMNSNLSFQDLDTAGAEFSGHDLGQFQYPFHEQDETTLTKITSTPVPNTQQSSTYLDYSRDNAVSIDITESISKQTETTIIPTLSGFTTASDALYHVTDVAQKPEINEPTTTFTSVTLGSDTQTREQLGITSTQSYPSNIDPFDLESKRDREYFSVGDNADSFPSRPGVRGQMDELLWKGRSRLNNCSDALRLQRQKGHHSTELVMTPPSSGMSNDGGGCEENQMLEKQETKLVHAPTAPSTNMSSPFYAIEARDKLSGPFFNISCVDAVHTVVNAKVNEILQQFGHRMGRDVCKNAPDASLELVAGNIRFKGSVARVYIKFAITYLVSSKLNVVDCGKEFESYVKVQLPRVLSVFLPLVVRENCGFINYTVSDFNVAHAGWTCRRGYTLNPSNIECNPTPVNHSDAPANLKRHRIDFIKSVPRLKMNFNGVFSVLGKQRPTRLLCVQEYEAGISAVLSKLEPYVQEKYVQCTNMYLEPSNNVSVLLTGKRIIAKASINLVPLKTSVDLESMTKCSRFLSLHFREPSQLVSTVTLGQGYLPTCPPIRLMPHGIRANLHFIYYCPVGFYYEAENFKCIHELFPMYTSVWTLNLEGPMHARLCQGSVQQAAVQLTRSLQTEIRQRIYYKHICNGTDDVILIPQGGIFDLTSSKITMKLVVSVTSLKGVNPDALTCMLNIHRRLETMLAEPKAVMIQKVAQACQSDLFTISNHPLLAYTKWECRQNAIYNSMIGKCDFLPFPSIRTKGIKSARYKRSLEQGSNPAGLATAHSMPSWTSQPPSCIDLQPPKFHNCPDRDITIVLGHLGPQYMTIPLPVAVDNSGQAVKISFEPADFVLPYRFSKNMSLVITALDSSENRAVCNLSIVVLDHIRPEITCPTEVLTIPTHQFSKFQPTTSVKQIMQGVAHATDNSGSVTVRYDVMNGVTETTALPHNVVVKATAQDESCNEASCSFFVRLSDDSCSVSSLPDPVNGHKECVQTGGDPGGLACSVSCDKGKAFAVQTPLQYICANSNVKWIPDQKVPACLDAYLPDFEISFSFNISYRDASLPECVRRAEMSVKNSIETVFLPVCGVSAMKNLSFSVHVTDLLYQYPTSNMISSTIKVLVHVLSRSGTPAQSPLAVACGSRSVPEVGEWINTSIRRHCAGIDIAPVFERPVKRITCTTGWGLVNSLCVECPAGTYCNNLRCTECPVGSYGRFPGATRCDSCAHGFSTRTRGATSADECYAVCTVDAYSPDGLEPCLPCPVGMYQPSQGESQCYRCDESNSTTLHCPDVCIPGTYSLNGKVPCYQCPVNTYNAGYGLEHCLRCPDGFVTQDEGTNHLDLCLEHDPCKSDHCLNEGECYRRGDHISCNCSPGYTGINCENIIDVCQPTPCSNGGTCRQEGHDFHCSCEKGYTGRQCEIHIDHCSPDPCIHGLCASNDTDYTCHCSPGFEGLQCDSDSDDCANITCHNGGQCEDLVDGFRCICISGYTGDVCDTDIDDCVDADCCLHGGSCVDGVDSYTCSCPVGFKGKFCETTVSKCDSTPCQNGAVCQDDGNGYSCTCKVGFTGNHCEQKIDFCESRPCWNNGECSNIHNTSLPLFSCTCKDGFTGALCHRRIDSCSSMPCNVNGTERCENGPASHVCICRAGWSGVQCGHKMDPCEVNQCQNEGTCINHDGHYFSCSCPPGFTGLHCEEQDDSCHPNPCHNKGKCVASDQGRQPKCLCVAGFSGLFCEDNIDECQSFPCQNGGTCYDGVDAFFCRCVKGFAGLTCETSLDKCLNQPCRGNQLCLQENSTFRCVCPEGTTGQDCESALSTVTVCGDDLCQNEGVCTETREGFRCQCQTGFSGKTCTEIGEEPNCYSDSRDNSRCLNGGVCVVKIRDEAKVEGVGDGGEGGDGGGGGNDKSRTGTPICLCPDSFSGTQCEKVQDSSFDLNFSDHNKPCHLGRIAFGNRTQLSLCLWVQIFGRDQTNHPFVILKLLDASNDTKVTVNVRGTTVQMVVVNSTGGDDVVPVVDVQSDTSLWRHLCVVIDVNARWTVWQDGRIIDKRNVNMEGLQDLVSLQLSLGRSQTPAQDGKPFTVSITDLNVFDTLLNDSSIGQLVKGRYSELATGLFPWSEARSCAGIGISIVEPSTRRLHSPTTIHSLGIKKPPVVSYCPNDVHVVTGDSPYTVTWKEPLFDSDSDIVSLQQNYYSGQAFPYGHHIVSYTIVTSHGNVASCSFNVFISRFTCTDPLPPINGARVCGEWHHGRYCIPSCLPYFVFISPVPPFYLCGKDGIWNPRSEQPFRFPVCARAAPPIFIMYGLLELEGPECNAAFLQQLKSHMTTILTQIDDVIDLCGDKRTCNYSQSLHADCGGRRTTERTDGARLKRGAGTKSVYSVQLNITFQNHEGNNHSPNGSEELVLNEVATSIKKSPLLTEFDLTSVEVKTEDVCVAGFVKVHESPGTIKCVECPLDHLINDQNVCEPCPRGTCNKEPGHQDCKPCPTDNFTALSLNCQVKCQEGTYLNSWTRKCVSCPRGQYQDEAERTHCKSCPFGLSTTNTGSKDASDCKDMCPDGNEIGPNNQCVPCPVGWYKNRTVSPQCIVCPFSWTTLRAGSTSQLDCSNKKCKPGQFLDVKIGICVRCPIGTFQPASGLTSLCQPCGIGLTTLAEGADRQSLCVDGGVSECTPGLNNCPEHTVCVDIQNGLFECRCKFGVDENGLCAESTRKITSCSPEPFSPEDQKTQGSDTPTCKCDTNGCKLLPIEKDYTTFLESLAVYSMVTAVAAIFIVLLIIAVVLCRRHRKKARFKNHVRLYRREDKRAAAFQNNAFDLSPLPISTISLSNTGSTLAASVQNDSLSIKRFTDDFIRFERYSTLECS